MTAYEDEAQPIVFEGFLVGFVRIAIVVLQLDDEIAQSPVEPRSTPNTVDSLEATRRYQPRSRIVGNPLWNDEMSDAVTKSMEATEAMLMAACYTTKWVFSWPTSDDEPIATTFNEMPKYVVSKTLSDATRNITTLINADIAAGIRDLKDRAPTE